MWFPFFKSDKNADRPSCLKELFNLETQKCEKPPSAEVLEEGLFPCSACKKKFPLDDAIPLSMVECPKCKRPNFVPIKISDFWLYRPLGGGGMGSVYRALDAEEPDADLAVKILPRNKKMDQYLIANLLKEAEVGNTFGEHPHLVSVYDYGLEDDEYYAAYDFVEGTRLDGVIDSGIPISEKMVLLWALQVLSAEQRIFDCGFLFRDLKPQNIIIDYDGNVKLFDYGLALTIEDALKEKTEDLEGSPHYVPPERVVGTSEAQCSEIYSLGMVMFHLIAHRTFYSADELANLFTKHVRSIRMSSVERKLPAETNPDIVRILNRMISKTPQERYQTYKEAASEIYQIYEESA